MMEYAGKSGPTRRMAGVANAAPTESLTAKPKSPRPIGTFATGIAIGLLLGAGLALLFAPQQGSETRHDIKRRLRRVGRRGRDAWDDLRDELRRATRQLRRARRRRMESEDPEAAGP